MLRSWEQKQALLTALRPRDRLRLLGLVRLFTGSSTAQTVISSSHFDVTQRLTRPGAVRVLNLKVVVPQVMAKRRVQRGGADERRYPTMQLARELVHGTGACVCKPACKLVSYT